jgi:hypothetical protein
MSYPDGKYRDGTIHITVDTGHDAYHTSLIDPNPLMHALDTAMMHYADPNARALAFAQVYRFKVGLKMFGEVGSKAAVTKLPQLHNYHIYNLVWAHSLTPAACMTVLELLMNIVKKRDQQVRAHAVTAGSKDRHQPGDKKEDETSPTIATDSIMITATIDAHECWDVATVDIPGAFLRTYYDKDTFMLLRRCHAKLMVQVDPALYKKNMSSMEKNDKVLLYIKLSKAIYGLLKSALLFYKKFVDNLKNYESPFIINPYDSCVANATISGLQMTVTWHVDDLKISQVDPYQITKFCQYLASFYGNGLMVHQGKVHKFLSMDLNFVLEEIIQVLMITYTTKVILDFPKSITSSCTSSAGDRLFTVRDALEAKFLPKEQIQAFHHTVAQLLFLCKRTRRDIQITLSFLTIRVKHPDKVYQGKLKRVF